MIKYKNRKIVLYGLIGLMCWLGYWLMMDVTLIDGTRVFGFSRYVIQYHSVLYHDWEKVAVEPHIFSNQFIPPYIYTYGVSGYTKTNVIPFGKVEKIANMTYYASVPDEDVGPFESTMQRLKNKYGSQLVLINSVDDISAEDYKVYENLQQKGRDSKRQNFSADRKSYPNKESEITAIEKNLDSLMTP